jgi:DNA-binding LytR/AlgR family response regulator
MQMNCLIIEDEKIAREGLADYVRRIPFLNLEGSFENPQSAAFYLQHHTPDLIFLDIEMQGINGMEFAQKLPINGPMIIFTTAYAQYALEGYSIHAVGYLVKPIFFEDFEKAVLKAHTLFEVSKKKASPPLYIKEKGLDVKIELDHIVYIKSMENYIVIQTETSKHLTLLSMKKVKQYLPEHFIFSHRSYIVNMNKAHQVDEHHIYLGSFKVPVSTRMKQDVKKYFINH